MCTGDGGTRAQEQDGAAASGGVDVLLVEDEVGLARSTREYLETFGLRAEHRATTKKAARTGGNTVNDRLGRFIPYRERK